MYSIIQKICEKHNKILKEGLEKVLKGEDISSLTSAIADFTNEMGKDLFSEIVKQIDDHIKQRKKKGCTISKIVTIYTGKRQLTKPEKEEKVVQIRRELVNKFTFSGLYKDNQELWEDVSYYIDCT